MRCGYGNLTYTSSACRKKKQNKINFAVVLLLLRVIKRQQRCHCAVVQIRVHSLENYVLYCI